MPMNKSDAAALRTVVRQRMKVLRADVEQRRAELIAESNEEVKRAMSGEDQLWSNIEHGLGELEREFTRRANDLVREQIGRDRWPNERRLVTTVSVVEVRRVATDTNTPTSYGLAQAAARKIEAMVKGAYHKLDRIEADLIAELTVGVLESAEAREFLTRIPTVGELVSADRLREITS